MARIIGHVPLLCGLFILTACAESLHQVQRDAELLGVPPGLEQEIDTSVAFADLKKSPSDFIGRTVMIGGKVIRAKRTPTETEVEVLHLPTVKDGGLTEDRLQSQGRFLATRVDFLDPASLPENTPITVIGTVTGETTRQLDESDYTYPVLEIKHIIDWNAIAAKRPRGRVPYYGAYYPPYGAFSGYGYPYGSYWGPFGGYGAYGGYYGSRGFWGPSRGFSPGPSSPPAPPPRHVHPRMRGR